MLKISKKLIDIPYYFNIFRASNKRFYFACDSLVRGNNNKSNFNVKVVGSPSSALIFPVFDESLRFKSKGRGKKEFPKKDDQSSDEEEEYEDSDESDGDAKIKVFRIKSLRADNILKLCLKLTKRKLEEVIFLNKVKLNNEALSKKGIDLNPGDVLELYGESTVIQSGNALIGRIEILNIDIVAESSMFNVKAKIQKYN